MTNLLKHKWLFLKLIFIISNKACVHKLQTIRQSYVTSKHDSVHPQRTKLISSGVKNTLYMIFISHLINEVFEYIK